MGDLEEQFEEDSIKYGVQRAKRRLAWNIIRFVRPGIVRPFQRSYRLNNYGMFKNYFKIALRHIWRGKAYAAINIFGLAVGFTCILLILSFINGELSYDQFHSKKELVYRVVNDHIDDDSGELTQAAYTYAPLAGLINENIPGIKRVLRIHEKQGLLWVDGKEKFIEKNFIYADSTFFQLFDFKIASGGIENALNAPFSAVISQKFAVKHFGTDNPIGRTINNQDDNGINQLVIRAVMEDFPSNTHLEADIICSMTTLQKIQPWNFYWYFPPMYTYVEFSNPPLISEIEEQITKHVQPKVPQGFGSVDYKIQKLNQIYLHSQREGEFRATGNYAVVVMFIIIASFILIIAAINFMNLTTARSIKKAKEVGLRKVMGAHRRQLLLQFLTESTLTTFISFIISIGLLLLLTGVFETVIGKQLEFSFLMNWESTSIALAVLLLIGMIAGLYPSLFLSSFNPIAVLKQQQKPTQGPGFVRRVLVVFQFVISCLLILGTVVIYQQMSYMRGKNLGFDKEQILVIPLEETEDQQNFQLLKDLLSSHSSVKNVTMTSGVPGTDGFYGFSYNIGTNPETLGISTLGTDADFVDTYNVKIVQGRNFSSEIVSDESQSFLVNQAAVKSLGFDEPLGKELTLNYRLGKTVKKLGQIVGVIEDFNFESLYHTINPLVVHILPPSYFSQYISVKVHKGQSLEAISHFENEWKNFNPNRPFEFFFLDDNLNKNYQSEVQLSRTFTWFAALAIFVSCLGLIGLAAFSVEQRTKEIGIRKVMGASISSILKMISWEYVLLIVLANLIAWPIGWYFLSEWLNDFAYRASLSWYVFIGTGFGVLTMALVSVVVLTARAAKANPIQSLRYE